MELLAMYFATLSSLMLLSHAVWVHGNSVGQISTTSALSDIMPTVDSGGIPTTFTPTFKPQSTSLNGSTAVITRTSKLWATQETITSNGQTFTSTAWAAVSPTGTSVPFTETTVLLTRTLGGQTAHPPILNATSSSASSTGFAKSSTFATSVNTLGGEWGRK